MYAPTTLSDDLIESTPESAAYGSTMGVIIAPSGGKSSKQRAADEVDVAVRALCEQRTMQQAMFGPWDAEAEAQWRREVHWLVASPKVDLIEDTITAYKRRKSYFPMLWEDDLRDSLERKLQVLIEVHLDPQQALVNSVVGFARMSLKNHARDWRRPTAESKRVSELPELAAPAPVERDEATETALVEFEESLRAKRGVARMRVSASGIRDVLGLPPLTLPGKRTDRDALYEAIREDEQLMPAAVDEYVDLIRDDPAASPAVLSDGGALFAGWSLESAERASCMTPELLSHYAIGSLSPLPRPGRDAIQRVRWLLREASRERGWTRLALQLIDTWLDEHCAATSDWDGRGDFDEAEEARAVRAQRWPAMASAAIEFRGDPLGVSTIAEVSAVIRRAFEQH